MLSACSTRRRTSDLDNDLERARRELAEFEQLAAEEDARRQAETRRWYERRWEKFQPPLDRFLAVFPMIQALETDWRRDVFCGRAEVDEQTDQIVRGLYAIWLFLGHVFKEKAKFIGRNLPRAPDKHLDRLEGYIREGERLLHTWERPVLSKGYSFRAPALSEEAAGRFRGMFPEKK